MGKHFLKLTLLSLFLFANPCHALDRVNKGIFTAAAGGGGGSSLAIGNAGGTISSSTLTTATLSTVVGADDDVLLIMFDWRRNSSQSVSTVTVNGSGDGVIIATQTDANQHRAAIYYKMNPTPGTYNVAVTMSASVPGFGMTTLTLKNSSAPINVGKNSTQSVTTSSATATTTSGDFLVSVMAKQDATTSEPVLNTAGATLFSDFDFNSGGAGNGGHFKAAYLQASGASSTINYSWPTAANHAHAWVVITP